MSDGERTSPELRDWIDAYLSDALDAAGLEALEARLRADPAARRYFVRYARLHTDLAFATRASRASERALRKLGGETSAKRKPALHRRARTRLWLLAAVFLGAGIFAVVSWSRRSAPGAWDGTGSAEIAWLVNAQDCEWTDGLPPTGGMTPGRIVSVDRGLAEIGFRSGVRVVLEGPASLELVSSMSARLRHGKATARVPDAARGFTIHSPKGQVVDLGTEFGMSVASDGRTEVFVFEGQVEASLARTEGPLASSITLKQHEAAILDANGFSSPAASRPARFVRGIVPPARVAPRTARLEFDQPRDRGVRCMDGLSSGLTHRLPGTGSSLGIDDRNLRLNCEAGQLELTTTNSDINLQYQLDDGEYLGLLLSDLGFTGAEDFAITVTIPDIPKLEFVGQFGLYAGTRSDRVIRGGLISIQTEDRYSQFLVNNDGGVDSDLNLVGLFSTGDDLRVTLRRRSANYSLTVENTTTGSSSTLAIRHPGYLDGEKDLAVGVFGANTQSNLRKTLVLQELEVTVWAADP